MTSLQSALTTGRLVTRLALMLGLRADQLDGLAPDVLATIAAHISESNRRIEALVNDSVRDDLTGVRRRGAGLKALEGEIQRARRSNHGLVVAFIDVDGLKRVNDSEGHPAGDRLIVDVAAALTGNLRVYDTVIRWGGDEFVCILPQTERSDASLLITQLSERLLKSTGQRFSVGLAELSQLSPGQGALDMIQLADSSLYETRRRRAEAV